MAIVTTSEDEEIEVLPFMTGWCYKKGNFGFRLRYCILMADGKFFTAKDDQTTEKKYVLDVGESSTLELARKADLTINGHNSQLEKERPTSITLRFHDANERNQWVEALNQCINKQVVLEGHVVENKVAPTLFKSEDMLRLRSILNGVDVNEDQIVLTMWQLKLTPRSIPVTDNGETLLGAGKSKISLRRYTNQFGTHTAKRLMVYEDPVKEIYVAPRKKTRACTHISRALMLDTPKNTHYDENTERCGDSCVVS